ncbi:MAG: hypothetical protein MUE85_25110 [Microscillaceae bacterium]|jgi:hypothetical protein|nr:hypothetical protein [Microscillaceae bacterium]
MKNLKTLAYLILIILTTNGCRTIREIKSLAKCEFRQKEISRLNLGSVNALQMESLSDFSFADGAKLAMAFKQGALPLEATYDIEIRNSEEKTAALERTDWILELDNRTVISGTTGDRVEVAPGGTGILRIATGFDLRKFLDKESLDSMVKLVAAMKGDNEEQSRIRLKIKPRFIIAGMTFGWPGYIKVGKTFKAQPDK